jgi:Domain of unknown function (DUF2382)
VCGGVARRRFAPCNAVWDAIHPGAGARMGHLAPAPIETVSVWLEQEHDSEVPIMAEEAAVDKQTRATKEVRVRKERLTVEADSDALRPDDTGPPQPRHRTRQ